MKFISPKKTNQFWREKRICNYFKIVLDFLYNALYAKITMKESITTQDTKGLEILCKCGCGKLFPPNRSWQKFYNPTHQKDYWKEIISNQYQLSKKVKELEDKIDQINISK